MTWALFLLAQGQLLSSHVSVTDTIVYALLPLLIVLVCAVQVLPSYLSAAMALCSRLTGLQAPQQQHQQQQ